MSAPRNVLANWAAFGLSVVVNFALTPFIIRQLGADDYGLWVLLASFVGYLGLLDLGVRSAIMRYVAKFHATRNHEAASQIASTGIVVFAGVATVALALTLIFAGVLVPRFNIPVDRVAEARIVVILGGLGICAVFMGAAFGGVLSALQRFDLSSLLDAGSTLVRASLVVLVLIKTKNLVALATVVMLVSLLRALGQMAVARRCYPELRLKLDHPDAAWAKRIFAFGLFSSIIYVSRTAIFSTDALVIGAFLPTAMIAYFSIAGSLAGYARQLVNGMAVIVSPRASALLAENRQEALARFAQSYARFGSLIILPVCVTFGLRGQSFIELWVGPEYAAPGGRVLVVLTLGLTFWAGHQVMGLTLIGINRHRGLAWAYLVEGVANICVSVYLVRGLGIVGVAWGTTLPSLVTSLLVAPMLLARHVPIRHRSIYWNTWGRPLVAAGPFALASVVVEAYMPAQNLVVYFLQIALCLPAFAVASWHVALDPHERKSVMKYLQERLS